MKKLLAILLALLTVSVLAISASAAVQDTNVKAEAGKYLVINMNPYSSTFNPANPEGVLFHWGDCAGGNADSGEGVKILAGKNNAEVIIGYASNGTAGMDASGTTLNPAKLPVFTMKYKTAEAARLGIKWATDGALSNWGTAEYFDVPASTDYTVLLFTAPATLHYDLIPLLFGMVTETVPADVYIAEIGFFATEAEAKTYYNIQDPAPEQPADPEQPAPETGDVMTSAIVVAAIALGLGVVVTKKKIAR